MRYEASGKENGPLLLCIPGMMGGPEDFRNFLELWQQHFKVIVLDPHSSRRDLGLKQVTLDAVQEFDVDVVGTADSMVNIIKELGHEKAFTAGVSLGGKMVYDFMIRHPKHFAGGLVTDIGPASFAESELYHYVDKSVMDTDMSLAWPEMKADLAKRITERNLRSLIQTQIFYPTQKPPAQWRLGMKNFREMLAAQSADDQMEGIHRVDEQLAGQGSYLTVLKAERLSAITPSTLEPMVKLKCLKIEYIKDCSHFLHISHRNLVQEKVVELLSH